MKKALLLLPVILLGLYLVFLPQVNTAVYEHETAVVLDSFEQQTSRTGANSRAHSAKDALYPELYRAMENYNIQLAEHQQESLTSPEVFESTSICLSNYGLEPDAPIAVLTIPAIDLKLPVYQGASKEHLAKGTAVLGQTSLPIGGADSNCVIAGHRGYRGIPYFRYLDRLEPGDDVILNNYWEPLTYEVSSIQVIEPSDLDAVRISAGRDGLTLLTCHPYTVGTHRLIIYCERVFK